MMNILRCTAAVAALALTATPALAAPVSPDKQATATARIVKPLTLTWVQDLDFGTVTLVDQGPTTITVAQNGTRDTADDGAAVVSAPIDTPGFVDDLHAALFTRDVDGLVLRFRAAHAGVVEEGFGLGRGHSGGGEQSKCETFHEDPSVVGMARILMVLA